MKICTACHAEFEDDAEVCPNDGTPLTPSSEPARLSNDLVGRRVADRFEVQEKLGSGGMGSVYLAAQEPVGRQVALKVLNEELSHDHESVARFRREAKAASMLKSPHTVTLYDFGQDDDGLLFLVMELLEGESLRERLDRLSRLEWQEALQLVRQVAESLSEAHAAGIVHRDLKPDNIFITRDGSGRERVKVLDFGIARLLQSVEGTESLTQKGIIFGTPGYMSPEQAKGVEVDARADLYSLGVVLYELLAGAPPFAAESIVMLLSQHITEDPEPIGARAPDLPPELEALVARLLAKDPDDRFQCADELLDELDALLGQSAPSSSSRPVPVTVTQPSPPDEQPPKDEASTQVKPTVTSRKSPLPVIVAVTLLVGLGVTAILFATGFVGRPEATPREQRSEATNHGPGTDNGPARATAGIVDIELAASPEGATFWLDDELLGTTPYTLQRERSDAAHQLVVKAAGHATIERVVRFDRSRTIELALHPLREASTEAGPDEEVAAPAKTKRPRRPVPIITEPP